MSLEDNSTANTSARLEIHGYKTYPKDSARYPLWEWLKISKLYQELGFDNDKKNELVGTFIRSEFHVKSCTSITPISVAQ